MITKTHFLYMLALSGTLLFATQIRRATKAHKDSAMAQRLLAGVLADADEIRRLRSSDATSFYGDPPSDGFLDHVYRILDSLGLPPSTAGSIINQDQAQTVAGTKPATDLRERRMHIELRKITVLDLGRFISIWNAENPAWRTEDIKLRKDTDRSSGPMDYHVTLTCSAKYTNPGVAP